VAGESPGPSRCRSPGRGPPWALLARSAGQLAETAAAILAAVERQLGPIDLLVNNAGSGGPVGLLA
jgi:NAD(P)-dependent dehydrogenase (short-subunit alcohol dehydrogenase family)